MRLAHPLLPYSSWKTTSTHETRVRVRQPTPSIKWLIITTHLPLTFCIRFVIQKHAYHTNQTQSITSSIHEPNLHFIALSYHSAKWIVIYIGPCFSIIFSLYHQYFCVQVEKVHAYHRRSISWTSLGISGNRVCAKVFVRHPDLWTYSAFLITVAYLFLKEVIHPTASRK